MSGGWVILLYSPSMSVVVVGTKVGKPYASEAAAARRSKKIEDHFAGTRSLVVEITEYPFE